MAEFENLPKWVYLENFEEAWFGVMHCRHPRLIVEFTGSDDDDMVEEGRVVEWVDEPEIRNPAAIASLLREAGEFLAENDLGREELLKPEGKEF